MGDQLGALGKARAALPTPIGLLPAVGPLVFGQLPQPGKALPTRPAVVNLTLGMSTLVVGQVSLLDECLPILPTGMATMKGGRGLPTSCSTGGLLFPCIDTAVGHEADLLAEALSTGSAGVGGLPGMVTPVMLQHLPLAAKVVPTGSADVDTGPLMGLLVPSEVDLLPEALPTHGAGVGILPDVNPVVGH